MDTQDTAELLAQLKGIHLPAPPAAPNLWPVYISALLCICALGIYLFNQLRRQNHWHKDALYHLDHIWDQPGDVAIQQTAALLKRIALTVDTNVSVKHLTGESWLHYLDNFYNTDFFTRDDGRIFGQALYQPNGNRHLINDSYIHKVLSKLVKRKARTL